MKLEPFRVHGRDGIVPGFVATNPNGEHRIYLAGENGTFYAEDLTACRLDLDAWKREFLARQITGKVDFGEGIASLVRLIAENLANVKKGGKGGESFKAVRESIRQDLRSIAELLGDDELAKELWDQVGPGAKEQVDEQEPVGNAAE